jgi:hypothetical protein
MSFLPVLPGRLLAREKEYFCRKRAGIKGDSDSILFMKLFLCVSHRAV